MEEEEIIAGKDEEKHEKEDEDQHARKPTRSCATDAGNMDIFDETTLTSKLSTTTQQFRLSHFQPSSSSPSIIISSSLHSHHEIPLSLGWVWDYLRKSYVEEAYHI
jgi:hypothetical protein